MPFRLAIQTRGVTQAINKLRDIEDKFSQASLQAAAVEIAEELKTRFEDATPWRTGELASSYEITTATRGVRIINDRPYAESMIVTGAKPHDIPNSFGWGHNVGFGWQRRPAAAFWHPGYQANEALHTLWEEAPSYLYNALQSYVQD